MAGATRKVIRWEMEKYRFIYDMKIIKFFFSNYINQHMPAYPRLKFFLSIYHEVHYVACARAYLQGSASRTKTKHAKQGKSWKIFHISKIRLLHSPMSTFSATNGSIFEI